MQRIIHILISIFLFAGLWDCAKTGNPSGGPKDITPPVVVRSRPLNGSVNFTGSQIEITFNEYIRPENFSRQIVVSPPLREGVETRMRGKTLVIDLQEDLLENTTYTLGFGQSVKDLNEGNVLENFTFVFSTGNYLDSLAVTGTVLGAFDLKPLEEAVYVMLYASLEDSVPYTEIPDYLGKTDENGAFLINHASPGTYRVFALQDQNLSLKYDGPEEQIGFLDTSIVLSAAYSMKDSLLLQTNDTLLLPTKDSLPFKGLARYAMRVDLLAFREDNEPQYLINNKREDRRKLMLLFNRELTDTVILEPLNFSPTENWFLYEEYVMKDTLVYWLTDSLIYNMDSLLILARYRVTDSLMNYVPFNDSLEFYYREPVQPTWWLRRREAVEETEKISLALNVRNGQRFDIFRDIVIEPSHPVLEPDTSRIRFEYMEDTLFMPAAWSLYRDPDRLRVYRLSTIWKEECRYRLVIYPGAFEDIYGVTHDTVSVNLQTRHRDHYARINIYLTGVDAPRIIQVLDNKGNVVAWKTTDKDGMVEFPYMEPATYTLKMIYDDNGNGRWDTGDYLAGIQPEKVRFHPGTLAVRSNFHYEINWNSGD